jgi:two-component system sensor histidine kinase CreC
MIRNRLILAYLLPTALILGLLNLIVYFEARANLEQELGARLTAVAQTTVATLPSGDPRRLTQLDAQDAATLARLRERLQSIGAATGARRLFIVDPQRRSLIDTRPDVRFGDTLFELGADQVELDIALQGQPSSSVLFTDASGTPYKNGYAPITHDGRVIGVLGVEGSASFFDALAHFRNALIALGALALAAVVAASILIARSITRPIHLLINAARRFGAGDLSQDVQLRRNDEFQTLTDAFNQMRADLLARDRQLQMMLSGIAHEVRNPLGGMELFTGLLAEDLADDPPRLEHLHKITRELRYLDRVVNTFLDYARKKPLDWQRFTAQSLLEDVAQLQRRELAQEQVQLHLQPTDLELTADKEQLHRLLLNLIRNAGQASAPNTTVTLSACVLERCEPLRLPEVTARAAAHLITPPAAEATAWRALLVSDQGRGIPPDKLEGIFEPFFTTKEKGSGLGLALLRKIVDEHGGALLVASTVRPEADLHHAISEQEMVQEARSTGARPLRPSLVGLQAWLGEEAMLGEEPLLGADAPSPRAQPSPSRPAPPTHDPHGHAYGTTMVVVLPFKDQIERAQLQIPEGWLG